MHSTSVSKGSFREFVSKTFPRAWSPPPLEKKPGKAHGVFQPGDRVKHYGRGYWRYGVITGIAPVYGREASVWGHWADTREEINMNGVATYTELSNVHHDED